MSKVHENVIRDLLPLYVDKVCSKETEDLVEAYLMTSPVIRRELEQMKAELPLPGTQGEASRRETNRKEAEGLKQVSVFWNRSKWKSFIKGAAVAVAVCGVIALGYVGLFRWSIVPVPPQVMKISEVSRLENGKVAYHITYTDGYESNRAKYEMDENGNFYVVPYRPVIPTKSRVEIAVSYYETIDIEKEIYRAKYGRDHELRALYYGKGENRILVWKEGMALPAASSKAEAWFQP